LHRLVVSDFTTEVADQACLPYQALNIEEVKVLSIQVELREHVDKDENKALMGLQEGLSLNWPGVGHHVLVSLEREAEGFNAVCNVEERSGRRCR
jgi:hypothetical protein